MLRCMVPAQTSGKARPVPALAGLLAAMWLLGVCNPAQAQQADPEEPPAAAGGLGDLDALLGIEPEERPGADGDRGAEAEALDAIEGDLDRALDGQEVAQAFEDAVALMDDSARLLDGGGNTGIETQRLQAEAIRKLDVLIQNAQQQQQQQQSQSQQQQQQQQNQPNQQQQQQQQQQGDNQQEQEPPAGQDAQLAEAQAADLARWGALPARVRDALIQGADERFSTLYRRMTEQYFERLAEESP